jgi:hypothetical protein
MVKHGKIDVWLPGKREFYRRKSVLDVGHRWREETRPGQDEGERIDVIGHDPSSKEPRFNDRRSPPGKRIIDIISPVCQRRNKKTCEVRLKTGTIGDLMERRPHPLPGTPKLGGDPWYPAISSYDRINICSRNIRNPQGQRIAHLLPL